MKRRADKHDVSADRGAAASSGAPGEAAEAPRPYGVLAGVALIALAAFVAYFPALHGEFILDDDILLWRSSLIKAPDGLYRFWFTAEAYDYWPVSNTTLWLEWRLWGMNPTGYHVTNLLVHIATACLIWSVLLQLSIPGAFLAALLFAVHPVNVESVAWIAQRKGLLALLFALLSTCCWIESLKASWPASRASPAGTERWYRWSLAAFVLAMLSKGSVAILPVLLLGVVRWNRPLTRRDLVRVAPFLVVSVVLVLVNVWFQTHGVRVAFRSAGWVERLLGAGAALWFYLSKALLPVNLSFVYEQWHIQTDQLRWWLPLAAAAAVTCVLWRFRRGWSRPVWFAWAYWCVTLAPVLGFTDVGFMVHSLVADHYQHLALIGVMALVAAGWGTWRQRVQGPGRRGLTAAACAAACTLTVLTWKQSSLYANALTLYQATLERNPASWMAHNNLGNALLGLDRFPEAIEHFREATRLKADYFDGHNNLGLALRHSGRLDEARPHIEYALRLNPASPEAHFNMAAVLFQSGRPREAIEEYELSVRLNPDFPEAQFELGAALAHERRFPEAIEHYRQALRIKPKYPEAFNNLGGVLLESGRLPEAIEQFERAVRLAPDFAEAQSNLGKALYKAGRPQQALERFQETVRLEPELAEARNDLGVALADTNRLQEAIEQFQQALRLRPDYADARSNLNETLSMQRTPSSGGND